MKHIIHDGYGNIVSETEVTTGAVPKSVYKKVDFLNKLKKSLRKQIAAEERAGNEDVIDWLFNVNAMVEIDLNNLPDGFVEGLDAMVANQNINITQNQVDNFLER
jgi:hypothetical protein